MKKFILTLVSIIALAAVPVLAATGVWTAVGGGGSSGGGGSCYLIKYASGMAMGAGIVSSGKFTGFLKTTPNPFGSGFMYYATTNASYGFSAPASKVADCGSSANCVYYKTMGIANNTYNVCNNISDFQYYSSGQTNGLCAPTAVLVTDLAINSAQPMACW